LTQARLENKAVPNCIENSGHWIQFELFRGKITNKNYQNFHF